MRIIIGFLITMVSAQAMAFTDFACVNRCTQAGNLYGLCQSRCSYGNSGGGVDTSMYNTSGYQMPQQQKIKQTDFGCVSRCTSQGYQYGLCKEQCSY